MASVISNIYGGDGITTFSVPNLQSHFISGCTGYGSSFLNKVSGTEYYSLQSNDLPSHSHNSSLSDNTSNHSHAWGQRKMATAYANGGNQLTGRNDNTGSGFTDYNMKSDTGNASHSHTVGNSNNLDNIGNSKPLRIVPAHMALTYLIKYQ